MAKAEGKVTQALRDYWVKNPKAATIKDLTSHLQSALGHPVAEAVIRRSLTELNGSGDVISRKDSSGIVWQPSAAKTPVPAPAGATTAASAPRPLTQSAKDALNSILDAKLAELNGETPKPEPEEEKPVVKKKLPAGIAIGRGKKYYPRELLGKKDVDILRQNRKAGIFVALDGRPGTGKTSLVNAAFGKEVHTIAGNEETQLSDIVGTYYQLPGGEWLWSDGPLTRAMREGGVAFFDDITVINPRLLATLYPVMDGRDELFIPRVVDGKPEVVRARPGFYLLCAHNPGTHGAIWNDALSSRFGFQVEVTTDYQLAAQMGVPEKILRVTRKLIDREDDPWVPQMRELEIFRDISTAHGEQSAAANLLRACPEDSRDAMSDVMRTVYGTDILPLSLGEQV